MDQVTAFKASDGILFLTGAECEQHEAVILWIGRINEFIESPANPYRAGAMDGQIRKIVPAWELFKATEQEKQA